MTWRKSSRSRTTDYCVEVAKGVQVRDSKDPDGPRLSFSNTAFGEFLSRVKNAQ